MKRTQLYFHLSDVCALSNTGRGAREQVEDVEYFQYSRGVPWNTETTLQLRAWHVLSGGATRGSGELEDALPGFDRSLYLVLEVRDLAGDVATIGNSPGSGNTTSLLDAVAGAHTRGGCRCQNPWTYYTDTFPGTCANPDGDSGGTWCFILGNSCARGSDLAAGANWDYCRTHVQLPLELAGDWEGELVHPTATCEERETADPDPTVEGCEGRCITTDIKCDGDDEFRSYYKEWLLAVACTSDGEGYYESYSDSTASSECTFFSRDMAGNSHSHSALVLLSLSLCLASVTRLCTSPPSRANEFCGQLRSVFCLCSLSPVCPSVDSTCGGWRTTCRTSTSWPARSLARRSKRP
jgi:hypothetical protein